MNPMDRRRFVVGAAATFVTSPAFGATGMQSKIERLNTAGLVDRLGWTAFLERWSTDVVKRLRLSKRHLNHSEREVLKAGTTTYPGATVSDVAGLERLLKIALSPSYKGFLGASN